MRDFTLEELSKYRDGEKIYLALGGKVYDVTKSAMFYGPGGAYHIFAGRDGTFSRRFLRFFIKPQILTNTNKISIKRSCDIGS